VASSRDRQRKLARAKLDRQMARRAGRTRRRRRVLAGVGAAGALLLIVGGVAWIGGAFDSDSPTDTTALDTCAWTPQNADTNKDLKIVGTPPTTGMATSGTQPMTITTNQGTPITVALDLAKAPCSAADLSFLAGKRFYDNTACTEITTEGALRCGDPAGNGIGGPTYSLYDEYLPTPAPSASAAPAATPLYPRGTVALIGNPPGTNGSQFLIFLRDFKPTSARYPIVGTVTAGTDTLAKIAKIATVDNGSGSKVKPKEQILIKSLTVGTSNAVPSARPSASSQS
jgi:peptidyl-prolyl cis-trans isomerase B (cyclophilin B)